MKLISLARKTQERIFPTAEGLCLKTAFILFLLVNLCFLLSYPLCPLYIKPQAGWQLSAFPAPQLAKYALDGNPETRWDSQSPQKGREYINLTLEKPYKLAKIELITSPIPQDYPRGLRIQVSIDGKNFQTDQQIPFCQQEPIKIIKFQTQKPIKAIKILQTGVAYDRYWSIYEMKLYKRVALPIYFWNNLRNPQSETASNIAKTQLLIFVGIIVCFIICWLKRKFFPESFLLRSLLWFLTIASFIYGNLILAKLPAPTDLREWYALYGLEPGWFNLYQRFSGQELFGLAWFLVSGLMAFAALKTKISYSKKPKGIQVFIPPTALSPIISKLSKYLGLIFGLAILYEGVTCFLMALEQNESQIFLFLWLTSLIFIIGSLLYDLKNHNCPWLNLSKKELIFLGLLFIVLIGYYLIAIDSYRYLYMRDDWPFYVFAKSLAGNSSTKLLSESGVFGYHPVLSSWYQALGIKLLPEKTNIGWRLSSVFFAALMIPFIYILTRRLLNCLPALIAVGITASSFLHSLYARFGYNNNQGEALAFMGLSVWSVALLQRSITLAFLAGWINGLGIHTYYSGRLADPMAGLFLLFLLSIKKDWRFMLKVGLAYSAGYLLWFFPLIVHPQAFLRNMLNQSSLGINEYQQALTSFQLGPFSLFLDLTVFKRITQNIVYMALYPLYYPINERFICHNRLTDIITGMLYLWGLASLFKRSFSSKVHRLLLGLWLFCLIFLGGLCQFHHPPVSRLLFSIPLIGLIAAVGWQEMLGFVDIIKDKNHRKKIKQILTILTVIIIVAYNSYLLFTVFPILSPIETEALYAQAISCLPKDKKVIILEPPDDHYHIQDLLEAWQLRKQVNFIAAKDLINNWDKKVLPDDKYFYMTNPHNLLCTTILNYFRKSFPETRIDIFTDEGNWEKIYIIDPQGRGVGQFLSRE